VDIEVDLGRIREVVTKVYRIISGRPVLPVLSGILCEAEEGELKLTATDYEIGVFSRCQAKVKKSGSAVLPGKVFYHIIRSAGSGTTRITALPDHTVEVRVGKGYYKLSGFPPSDFPLFPPLSQEFSLSMEGAELKEALLQTYFSVSKDEMRPPLTGIFMNLQVGKLHFVSTDGHRLSVRKIKEVEGNVGDWQGIIPAKTASELLRLVPSGRVRIFPGKGEILIELGETFLFSRLIEGEYPKYEQVIPQEFTTEVELSRSEFMGSLERVSLVSTLPSPVVEMVLKEDEVEISCQSPEVGMAREEVGASVSGERITLAFNARYLLEALRVVDWEKVRLGLSGELSPAKVFEESSPFQYVIMPVKLREG